MGDNKSIFTGKSGRNLSIVIIIIALLIFSYFIYNQLLYENTLFDEMFSIYSTSGISSNILMFDFSQYQWLSILAGVGLVFAFFILMIEIVDILILARDRATNAPMTAILVDKWRKLLFMLLMTSAILIVVSSLIFIFYSIYPSLLEFITVSEMVALVGYIILSVVVIKWSVDIWRFI